MRHLGHLRADGDEDRLYDCAKSRFEDAHSCRSPATSSASLIASLI
jgi:hypothetical protein